MKKYERPSIDIVKFDNLDVMMMSGEEGQALGGGIQNEGAERVDLDNEIIGGESTPAAEQGTNSPDTDQVGESDLGAPATDQGGEPDLILEPNPEPMQESPEESPEESPDETTGSDVISDEDGLM